jgi:hypothetical protein
MILQSSKFHHGLVPSDINPKDKQNFKSCLKICSDDVLSILRGIPDSHGMHVYLSLLRSVIVAYVEKSTSIQDRLYYSWFAVFLCRLWRAWLDTQEKQTLVEQYENRSATVSMSTKQKKKRVSKQQFTVTNPAFFSIELNAHSLIYLLLLARGRRRTLCSKVRQSTLLEVALSRASSSK